MEKNIIVRIRDVFPRCRGEHEVVSTALAHVAAREEQILNDSLSMEVSKILNDFRTTSVIENHQIIRYVSMLVDAGDGELQDVEALLKVSRKIGYEHQDSDCHIPGNGNRSRIMLVWISSESHVL